MGMFPFDGTGRAPAMFAQVRSRAGIQSMTARRRTLQAIISDVLALATVLFLFGLVLAPLWR
jgi:hypothetical protein